MKPAPFDYVRPDDVPAAIRALADGDDMAKVVAGGQSLGPALNLRLAQPERLVDIRRIRVLNEVTDAADSVLFGACVTHAAIEDGRVPDATGGFMRRVAQDIAYRAVRNRGTIGGSLSHADPAADWVSALTLLSAVVIIEGPDGRREVGIEDFVTGPFDTQLGAADILIAIRIPKLSARARWSYYKFCRKPGEFAEAIAAVLSDEARGISRAVIGATNGAPHVIAQAEFLTRKFDPAQARAAVDAAGADDPYERQVHFAALQRATSQLAAVRP
ncbi:MAG: FAD binding domain-containing protein [Burkholderiales bacterium]